MVKDSGLLKIDAVSLNGWFSTFRRQQYFYKCREPLTKQHSITSQKNWFLRNKVGRTLNIGYIGGRVKVNCEGRESEVIWPNEGNIGVYFAQRFRSYLTGNTVLGAENLAPTGIRSADRPARSQSLYRLSYPGSPYKV
jgi:hypothetical protein